MIHLKINMILKITRCVRLEAELRRPIGLWHQSTDKWFAQKLVKMIHRKELIQNI